ncbi:NAD(P)-dependent dehydrogenase (short-subunit alcohol dehydrogenase family) [Rhizobium leguminosarum]|nr:NAD(P)-dependent dehydrogenase (short-subunit alcohol dehydrogenase family) [Rhizobium leguminosarum]
MNHKRLRSALVTGAAKRIGRAIAEDLAANGFSVAIHANGSIGEAEELAAELRQKGYRAIAIEADLTDIGETSALVAKASEALGHLDLLVNNASIFRQDSARSFDAQAWAQHFDIHVRAPSILAAAFASCPTMRTD